MTVLDDLKAFDVAAATVTLWVFKMRTAAGHPPTYTGRWVETTNDLDQALKDVVCAERDRIEETQAYGLLAQNNEASALSISSVETHAGLVLEQTAAELNPKKVTKLKQIQGSKFYVVKLVLGETAIYAVSKTDRSWHTKRARDKVSAFFADEHLTLDTSPSFDLSKSIDFFIVGDEILVTNKSKFESTLNYKQAHQEDFAALQAEEEFSTIFTNIAPLRDYVGQNKIQLRRASAIRQKGYYKLQGFMANLRNRYAEFGLNLIFDDNGQIVPTPETCKDIFLALLDHRLSSAFSGNVYDVQDTTPVAIG